MTPTTTRLPKGEAPGSTRPAAALLLLVAPVMALVVVLLPFALLLEPTRAVSAGSEVKLAVTPVAFEQVDADGEPVPSTKLTAAHYTGRKGQ